MTDPAGTDGAPSETDRLADVAATTASAASRTGTGTTGRRAGAGAGRPGGSRGPGRERHNGQRPSGARPQARRRGRSGTGGGSRSFDSGVLEDDDLFDQGDDALDEDDDSSSQFGEMLVDGEDTDAGDEEQSGAAALAEADRSSKAGLIGAVLLGTLLIGMLLFAVGLVVVGGLLGFFLRSGSGTTVQIGTGSSLPPRLVALRQVFNNAGRALGVDPYLLASVADQESGFSHEGRNSSGCAGFMEIGLGGACGDTWDMSVRLTGHPSQTVVVRDAYKLGTRPSSYPLAESPHPNVNDPFDAVMAAAVTLRSKVGGKPIPQLNSTAYQALCGYYGACADATVDYATEVLDRAKQWQAATALDADPVPLTPGQTARIILRGPNAGKAAAPTAAPAPVIRAIAAANKIYTATYLAQRPEALNTFNSWYDCSASVAYVLYNSGLNGPGVTVGGPYAGNSSTLASYGDSGPGKWITVYTNPLPGAEGHAFIVIAGRAFDTADFGGPDIPSGSGPRWRTDPTANLADGNHYLVRHPPGAWNQ